LLEASTGELQKDSLGGEEEGRDSASEQKEPLREESLDEENCLELTGLMLKYLSSWATAERMSGLVLELSELPKLKESPAALGFALPNIGSCLTVPAVFFSVGD